MSQQKQKEIKSFCIIEPNTCSPFFKDSSQGFTKSNILKIIVILFINHFGQIRSHIIIFPANSVHQKIYVNKIIKWVIFVLPHLSVKFFWTAKKCAMTFQLITRHRQQSKTESTYNAHTVWECFRFFFNKKTGNLKDSRTLINSVSCRSISWNLDKLFSPI